MAAADRLPNQTPENQVFSMASSVEAIGSYSGSQSLQWTGGYDPVSPAYNVYNNAGVLMSTSSKDELISNLASLGGQATFVPSGGQDNPWKLISIGIPSDKLNNPIYADYPEVGTYAELFRNSEWMLSQSIAGGHGGLHTGILDPTEVRATTAYSEMTQTNGGYTSETKTFDPDTRNKALDLYNVEATKTFTYATDANTGSVAQSSEMIALDLMGSPTSTADVIACPFGPSMSEYYPAFCNVVYA